MIKLLCSVERVLAGGGGPSLDTKECKTRPWLDAGTQRGAGLDGSQDVDSDSAWLLENRSTRMHSQHPFRPEKGGGRGIGERRRNPRKGRRYLVSGKFLEMQDWENKQHNVL